MEVVLPLFMRVLGREGNRFLTSNYRVEIVGPCVNFWVNVFENVHVPNANNEVTELLISLDLGVGDLMILDEVFKSYNFIISEPFVCAV